MDTDLRITIIAAVAQNGVIGNKNELPWRGKLSADMKRFKALTMGYPIIMGRKTHQSLGRPLPGRMNIVVTSRVNYPASSCTIVSSLEQALTYAHRGSDRVFIIGGGNVYRQALPLADEIFLTLIHHDFVGDTSFPLTSLNPAIWRETARIRSGPDADNWYPYSFVSYVRNSAGRFVNLDNARTLEQRIVMRQIQERGICPFCPSFIGDYHKQPIIMENQSWMLTTNQWPYENTRIHLLAIRREHAERLAELTDRDWCNLGELMRWAEAEYQITGGGLGLRFGDPSHNGGTVKHLHAQLLTADITDQKNPLHKPVRLRLS